MLIVESCLSRGQGSSILSSVVLKTRPLLRSFSKAAQLPETIPASKPSEIILPLRGAIGLSNKVGVEISSHGSVWRACSTSRDKSVDSRESSVAMSRLAVRSSSLNLRISSWASSLVAGICPGSVRLPPAVNSI